MRRDHRIIMFPYPHGQPTLLGEALIGVAVPGPVALDLGSPELFVAFWPRSVFRASVPEAAVYEHGHLDRAEDHVRLASNPGDRPTMYAVPQAATMQFAAQCDL